MKSIADKDGDHSQPAQENSTMTGPVSLSGLTDNRAYVMNTIPDPTGANADGLETLLDLTKRIDGPYSRARKFRDGWYAQFDNDGWDIQPVPKDEVNRKDIDTTGKDLIFASRKKPKLCPGWGRLPTELRLMIWDYALPEPRVVDLTSSEERRLFPQRIFFGEEHLLTCKEARDVFLKRYRNVDDKDADETTIPMSWNHPCRYIDEIRDTLVVDFRCDIWPENFRYDLSRVQNIAFTNTWELTQLSIEWHLIRKQCPALKTITVIVGESPSGHADQQCLLIDLETGLQNLQLPRQRYQQYWHDDVQEVIDESRDFREDFESYKESHKDDFDGVYLNVALLGKESLGDKWFMSQYRYFREDDQKKTNTNKLVSDMNVSKLTPVYKQSRVEVLIGGHVNGHQYYMDTSEVDGTLHSRYDGMKELFDPDEYKYPVIPLPQMDFVEIEVAKDGSLRTCLAGFLQAVSECIPTPVLSWRGY